MFKRVILLILSLTILITFFSCGREEGEGEYLTFSDKPGNKVSLDEKPSRVAVLFSSLAEAWTLAGGEVSITVGETVERGFAPSDTLLVDTGAGKSISTELLISDEPDLVICSADISAQVDTARLLKSAGIPVALMRVDSFSNYLFVLGVMTDITGDKEAYRIYGTEVGARIDALIDSAPENGPRVLFIRASTSAKSTKAKASDGHFVAGMLSALGARNIADDAPILLDGLNIESIIEADPDMIFITTMGNDADVRRYMDSLLESDAYSALRAVKNGDYFYLPKEYTQFKPNAKWYEAYYLLWEMLYAE